MLIRPLTHAANRRFRCIGPPAQLTGSAHRLSCRTTARHCPPVVYWPLVSPVPPVPLVVPSVVLVLDLDDFEVEFEVAAYLLDGVP